MLHMKRPKKKEENDEEELTVAGKKRKIKKEKMDTVKNIKAKAGHHKKAKKSA